MNGIKYCNRCLFKNFKAVTGMSGALLLKINKWGSNLTNFLILFNLLSEKETYL